MTQHIYELYPEAPPIVLLPTKNIVCTWEHGLVFNTHIARRILTLIVCSYNVQKLHAKIIILVVNKNCQNYGDTIVMVTMPICSTPPL